MRPLLAEKLIFRIFWAIVGYFWPFLRVFGQNEENGVKYQKSAQYIFLPLHVSDFILSFRKIVWAVSERIRYERTDGLTDGGDFIGPFGFQPGTKKR